MSGTAYLWLKALHLIGMVCWFAALFYLPRLFVYHSATEDEAGKARFQIMESKLYRVIMRPSMIITLVFGLWILVLRWEVFASAGWLWIKLAAVIALLGYHHYCARLIKAFAADESPHSERFYRFFNEIPALLLILIVILVVVKPF